MGKPRSERIGLHRSAAGWADAKKAMLESFAPKPRTRSPPSWRKRGRPRPLNAAQPGKPGRRRGRRRSARPRRPPRPSASRRTRCGRSRTRGRRKRSKRTRRWRRKPKPTATPAATCRGKAKKKRQALSRRRPPTHRAKCLRCRYARLPPRSMSYSDLSVAALAVMSGLVPRIHVLFGLAHYVSRTTWPGQAGASPPSTKCAMKNIGFLSFGHWTPSPQSQTRTAADALLQSIELAVAAEELGADGAYFRVHHFARQLGSPFPLLAACGARTKRIEIGTAVIDMRYENPLYMAEDAGAADLIAGGRLQLGISRGSPEQVIDGLRYFGYAPAEGRPTPTWRGATPRCSSRCCAARASPSPIRGRCSRTRPACCASSLIRRACASASGGAPAPTRTAEWAAKLGMNLQSSTLKIDESGKPFHVQQAGRSGSIRRRGRRPGTRASPRVSVSRSIFALVNDHDRMYFGRDAQRGPDRLSRRQRTRHFRPQLRRRAGRAHR